MRKLLTTTLFAVFLPLVAFSQCSNLKLSVDKKIQCSPGIVIFKVTGAPAGSKYSWDFGKGFVSNTDTVYEFSLTPQLVDVEVKVTFPSGSECLVAEKNITQILGKPELSYVISRRKLCDGPDTVTLINTTPNTKEISWVVDGTNYFNASNTLIHKFKTIGSKDVNLVVTDSFGCRDVKEFKDVAIVHPDVAIDFVADNRSGCVTKQVQLAAMVDANGETITNTEWYLPGSNTSFTTGLVPPVVRYVVPGGYDVSFTVETKNKCTHVVKRENYLNFGDSITIDLSIKDTVLCLKNKTEVTVLNPVKGAEYVWQFEGNPDTTHYTDTKLDLKYNAPGEYGVSLLLNYAGCFSRVSVAEGIKVKSLEAKFTSSDNYHCYTPHLTHITNTSHSYQNTPLTYQWSVSGDNGKKLLSSTDSAINYSSPKWGRYSVKLIAKDLYGCKDTLDVRQFIRVDSIRPTMTSDERIGCVDQTIKLTSITPASSYISPDSFYWVVYDLDGKTIYNKGKGRNIEQSFTKPGFYNVTLYAGNLIGCIDSLPKKSFIHIIEPVKSFEIADSTICSGDEVELKAKTTPIFAPFLHSWKLEHDVTGQVHTVALDTGRNRHIALSTPGPYSIQYNHQISTRCKDSTSKPASLHVNGVGGSVSLDHHDGCLPFAVKPAFNINLNEHFGNSVDTLQYAWYASPSTNVDIVGASTSAPKFTFNDRGTYRIHVTILNSTDCKFETHSQLITAGVQAGFSIPNDSLCALDSIALNNTSSLNATSFKWKINSTGKYTLRQSVRPNRLIMNDDAWYEINLIASKRNECYDTATKMVRAVVVESAFEMADTSLFCAPAYAQFNTLSENADTFFWDFGDGSLITTTDTFIANIYHRNTGFHNGFDVTLTSKSYLGCSDKITIKDAIRVFGPVPDFEIKNFVGCEPLHVDFINKSIDAAEYYLNYDDNTPLDSTQINSHVYNVQNAGMSQRYIPSLYVKDSLGCAAAFESTDTVYVLKTPKAFPSDKEIEGCSPIKVELTDESLNITSRSWLLDDVEISTENSVSPLISAPGSHLLQLIITNENNCSDTSNFDITVKDNPISKVVIDVLPCKNEPTEFTAKPLSRIGIIDYIWTINNVKDTTTQVNFSYVFSQSGRNDVNLKVVDYNGCSHDVDTAVVIKSVEEIPDGKIKLVSIKNNSGIVVQWNDIDPDFIKFSTIIDNQSQQIVYQNMPNTSNQAVVPYTDIKLARCFTMTHTNQCDEVATPSMAHCPVILTVTKGGVFALNLDWTSYSGWTNIDRYVVFRSIDGVSFEEAGTVSGTTLHFTDSMLCDQDYIYKVEAHYDGVHSQSNIEGNRPDYIRSDIPMDVKVATVINNTAVEVSWDSTLFEHTKSYLICKRDETGTAIVDSKVTEGLSFVDTELDVSKEHYIYTVQTMDHCLVTGVIGNIGLPMLLEGYHMNDMSHLSWTAYERWDDGVDYYRIQIKNDGVFTTIGQVPGSQSAFVDKDEHIDIDGEYVFRIIAVSFDSSIQSTSNEIRLIGSSLVWIPNAFSPNEDDHNPVFKPTPKFMYLLNDGTYREYEMIIYNRWGEEVFSTNDVQHGWDGTYKGKDCEMESYLYHIRISGLDRVVYDKKGLVRLMR
jgi:gliding motility-associated-like protein